MKQHRTLCILLAAGCAVCLAGGMLFATAATTPTAVEGGGTYTVRFDAVREDVFLPSAAYAEGETVELPACGSKQFGGRDCEFLYWADAATGEKVAEPFEMPGRDVSLYAVYGNGMLSGESDYTLTERGYVPVKTLSEGGLADCTLSANSVYSVEMVLPADPASYTGDCGPTFAAENYDGAFSNYLQLFVANANSASAGSLQLYLITSSTVRIKQVPLSSLWGTEYYDIFTSWMEKGGERTLSFAVRPDAAAKTWTVWIEGEEVLSVAVKEHAALTESFLSHSAVGFRSKTRSVRFFAPRVTSAEACTVTLDANGGTFEGDAAEKKVGVNETPFPTPSRAGYTFRGWFTLSASGEEVYHTAAASPFAVLYAKWTHAEEEIYTIEIATGIEGYTVQIPYYQVGSKVRIPRLHYEGMTFGRELYYDEDRTKPVDFSDFQLSLATESGGKITLYVSASDGGDEEGGERNPYLLSSRADFEKFASDVNNGETFAGKFFKLTQNIDLQNMKWTPIGGNFLGTLDGGNFEISNIKADGQDSVGLFSRLLGGTFLNLKLHVNITASGSNAGGLAGSVSGGTVTVRSVEVRGSVAANSRSGGLIGWTGNDVNLHVDGCINRADVTVASSGQMAGGIIGSKDGTTVLVENCKNYGTVTGGKAYVGGIVGILRVGTGTAVKNCYNFGNIVASEGAQYVGGVVGLNRARVENCYMLQTATITCGTTVTAAKDIPLKIGNAKTCGYLVSHEDSGSPVVVGGGRCNAEGTPV